MLGLLFNVLTHIPLVRCSRLIEEPGVVPSLYLESSSSRGHRCKACNTSHSRRQSPKAFGRPQG